MYNFGLHVAAADAPEVQGFVRREPLNFAAAEKAQGFVGRSGYRGTPGPRSWGVMAYPRFLKGSGFDSGPSSLSLWHDIESLMAFAYAGVHAEAIEKCTQLEPERNDWPPLVLWWVEAGRRPDWQAGSRQGSNGCMIMVPGPGAFTFKEAYRPDGEPYWRLIASRVKALVEANAPGSKWICLNRSRICRSDPKGVRFGLPDCSHASLT
jgi:hypothetical protein